MTCIWTQLAKGHLPIIPTVAFHYLEVILILILGSTRYLRKEVQNEIIYVLAQKLEDILVAKMNKATFFFSILVTIQDITKVYQLRVIIIYNKAEVMHMTEQEQTI